VIGTIVGHFRIESSLGAGGMGEVYKARDLKLDRTVALKFIHPALASDPEARQRFEREARALAALDHGSVGAVYGVEEADGRLFMVLAYIDGRSLASVLADGPLPPGRLRTILPAIADGLAAAHRRGIVHRDMKSANVMVGPDDAAKVVDFGIAQRGGETRLTQTGVYAGTPGFTAPEVFRGAPADARSDVFSLGVVLYHAITGRLPFDRSSAAAAMHAVLEQEPAPFARDLPTASLALEPIVLRCLAKDPAQRYADAGEVAAALHAWAAGAPIAETVRIPRAKPARRGWALFAALVLAVLAFATWTAFHRRAVAPAGNKRAIAVLEFENVTGDPSLDWMKRGVSELLGSALVQSPSLDVFDAQRLGDLAAKEHREAAAARGLPFLAQHGIRRAIAGSILRSGGDLMIQGRIVDTADGRPIHAYQVEGAADSGLFHLVGRMIPDLQVALEVNLTGDREAEGWLREITTTSVDAYRAYLRGHQALLDTRWPQAVTAYEEALALDSTFIAARTELSGAYWNLGDDAKLQLTLAAMRRLRGHADHRGQLRIDLLQAVVTDDPPNLIRAASELAQLYPENQFYTYLLGRGYYTSKQYRRCIDTLAPLVEQRYAWAWTYVLTARSAEQLGDTTAARRAFDLGMEVSHGNPELAYAYAQFLHRHGDAQRIHEVIEHALRSPTLPDNPVGEGEIRLEEAKDRARLGDLAGARTAIARAVELVPREDEAWTETDSLRRAFGAPR
jgi:tRNA A-37 threonylcarbamoyl transferase component Bud32/TolB-like protein/tetratricopeptide (TPR) repeat protein